MELIDFGCQDEIALRQTVDLVRPGCDHDFSPGKEDVWVVPSLTWHVLGSGFCRSTAESISWSIHGPIIVTEGSRARFW